MNCVDRDKSAALMKDCLSVPCMDDGGVRLVVGRILLNYLFLPLASPGKKERSSKTCFCCCIHMRQCFPARFTSHENFICLFCVSVIPSFYLNVLESISRGKRVLKYKHISM